jgi:hypothetical protein
MKNEFPLWKCRASLFKTTNRAVAVLSEDNYVFLNFNTAYWLQTLDLQVFRYAPCAYSHQRKMEKTLDIKGFSLFLSSAFCDYT